MQRTTLARAAALVVVASLAACGGGGGSSSDSDSTTPTPIPTPTPTPTPTPSAGGFSASKTWTFQLPASGQSLCYDFDAGQEVANCQGDTWDLEVSSGGRSASFWTNSGISGTGKGGAFGGPFDRSWTELQAWKSATVDPVDGAMPDAVFFKDSSAGIFTGSNAIQAAAFEYSLNGDYQLYPNYRVFLVTTDSSAASTTGTAENPVYALQITGYYGGTTGVASGHVSLRWLDRSQAGAQVQSTTVDATSETAWAYLNLKTGAVVTEAEEWHVAFSRYKVKLNGGDSGTGKVAGFLGSTPTGFYDEQGKPIDQAFTSAKPADTLAALTAADLAGPATARNWVADADSSALDAGYRGSYPSALDFGWYRYFPTAAAAEAAGLPATAHLLAANPEGASILKSGEGNSYARFHVTDISYADTSDNASAQTWTIVFDVQPKAGN